MKSFLVSLCVLLALSCVSFAQFDFEIQNRNITYQEDELKFYENGELLSKEDVAKLFPEYKVITISSFDKNKKYYLKNSLFNTQKILLLNNTNRTFHRFFVYPESSRNQINKEDKKCVIKSLISVYGKKNVRLKHEGGDEFEIVVK